MNTEMIKLYLKKLTEKAGNLYSFNLFSDGSGSLKDIRENDVVSWCDEGDMYLALLSICTPTHCAKEALLNFLGDA